MSETKKLSNISQQQSLEESQIIWIEICAGESYHIIHLMTPEVMNLGTFESGPET